MRAGFMCSDGRWPASMGTAPWLAKLSSRSGSLPCLHQPPSTPLHRTSSPRHLRNFSLATANAEV